MTSMQTWGSVISISMTELWSRIIVFLPIFIGALLVFLLGLLFASITGKTVAKILKTVKLDSALERLNLHSRLKHIGIEMHFSEFLGKTIEWFLVLVFLMVSADILGLKQVTAYLNSIILYVPNLVVATIILTIAFLFGNIFFELVRGSTRAAGVVNATLLATLIRWAIIIFGLLAALVQLGIAVSLVNTIFIGVVSAVSLALGLAFGLGGKEEAALILKKLREEMMETK